MQISSPWETYVKKLRAFFHADPEVEVGEIIDKGDYYQVRLAAASASKAFALTNTLARCVEFGNVALEVKVDCEEVPDVVMSTFEGNSLFTDVVQSEIPGGEARYIVLEPGILQIFNDNISSHIGASTYIAETVAREIFNLGEYSTYICTDKL